MPWPGISQGIGRHVRTSQDISRHLKASQDTQDISSFLKVSQGVSRYLNIKTDFPVDEVTVSVDEGTGKSVFIDKRELGMSVAGFWGRETNTGGCPTSLTV